MLTLLISLVGSASAADCPAPTTTGQLTDQLESAEIAYSDLDVPAFQAAVDAATTTLPCLQGPITKSIAAQFHRVQGLLGFIARDPGVSTQSFAAARGLEPGYSFPTTLVPQNNPVLTDYTAIDPASGKTRELPQPKDGHLLIDGRNTQTRPVSFPTIFQIVNDQGAVVATAYLGAADATPSYEPAPASAIAGNSGHSGAGDNTATLKKRGPSLPLLGGAGAAAVVAGVSFAVASSNANTYWNNTSLNATELNATKSRVNTMVMISGVSAVVAVGLGTTSFLLSTTPNGTALPALRARW